MEPIVDIVIPVFNGLEETKRCIASVLGSPQATLCEVTIIDDSTPEADLRAYLDELARDTRVTVIRNARNCGFVRVANQAFRLHQERDVVLLNSNTEVANDWVDRLRKCATSDYKIATVTPFSNNAAICSYPIIGHSNALPREMDTAQLDAVFRAVNFGRNADVTTGVGFCLYIPRLAIDALGGFDEFTFEDGYGDGNYSGHPSRVMLAA